MSATISKARIDFLYDFLAYLFVECLRHKEYIFLKALENMQEEIDKAFAHIYED
jgi:hypothetical protein